MTRIGCFSKALTLSTAMVCLLGSSSGQQNVQGSFVPSQFTGKGIEPNDEALKSFEVTYSNVRSNGGLSVHPVIPYVKTLREGGPIKSIFSFGSPFTGDAVPEVSFKINNTTKNSYYATGITLRVIKSTKIIEPIPVLVFDLYNPILHLVNYGSAQISNVSADIALVDEHACLSPFGGDGALPLARVLIAPVVGATNYFSGPFSEEKIPPLYRDAPARCGFGFLNFDSERGKRWRIPFSTIVFHRPPFPLAPLPPSQTYDVSLPAGRQNYSVEVPISQVVPSGQADFIKLRIVSDAWASFEIEAAMNSSNGQSIPLGKLDLEYFNAGGDIKLAHSQFRKLDLALTPALRKFVLEVAENPFNSEDVIVLVNYPEYDRHFVDSRAALDSDLAQLLRKSRRKADMCVVGDLDGSDCLDMRSLGN